MARSKPKSPKATGKMTQKQLVRANLIGKAMDNRIAKYEAKQRTKQLRRSEYYKTKRTTARATAAASAITASEESRQKTKRIEAQERTRIASISIDQYAKLINGNQGSENVVNPTDTSGNPSTSWVPNDTL